MVYSVSRLSRDYPKVLGPKSYFSRNRLALGMLLALILLVPGVALGEPIGPPLPATYKINLRYAIDATREQHVIEFDRMVRGLQKVGFVFDPPLEDLPPTIRENQLINLLQGKIAGSKMIDILRVPHVQTVVAIPENFAFPKPPRNRVQIKLELAGGLSRGEQFALHQQVRAMLGLLGFEEMVGYDDRGYFGQPYTRLRGTIPVDQVEILVKDLRGEPTGWFAPKFAPQELPSPLRQLNPIRIVEVVRGPTERVSITRPPAQDNLLIKIDPDLHALLKAKLPSQIPQRIEVILGFDPNLDDKIWIRAFAQEAPDFLIEGRMGNFVQGVFGQPYYQAQINQVLVPRVLVGDQILALARLPFVSYVRIPPKAVGVSGPIPKLNVDANAAKILDKTGLTPLHQKGHKGKGVRLAIIDGDFLGYDKLIGSKQLTATTKIVDLTTERNQNIYADPMRGRPGVMGHGTRCALAAHLAAPEAELVLIRIDPSAPYMMETALRYIRGRETLSSMLIRRISETEVATSRLRTKRIEIMKERAEVLENFRDDSEEKELYGFLGVVRDWVFTPRQWHFRRLAELEEEERLLHLREDRLLKQIREVGSLKGVQIISSSLVWNADYPLAGRSPISHMLDRELRPIPQAGNPPCPGERCPPQVSRTKAENKPYWFQAAGNTGLMNWNGLYRDDNDNGVMEFAPISAKLAARSWTPELNFLAWKFFDGKKQDIIPSGTAFQLSVQWTEAHDPDYFSPFGGEKDWYQFPLADMRIVVLRQFDPSGKTFYQDDFEVVAVTTAPAVRLDQFPDSATYQLNLPWVAKNTGRYAIRIEKKLAERWVVVSVKGTERLAFQKLENLVPTGIRPLGAPTLPELEKQSDLRPRILLQTLPGPSANQGWAILEDFFTNIGEIAVPAAAREVVSVGVSDFSGKPLPYSASGPPMNQALFPAPLLFSLDAFPRGNVAPGPAFGTALASPLAAGTAAAMMSAGYSHQELRPILFRRLQDDYSPTQAIMEGVDCCGMRK